MSELTGLELRRKLNPRICRGCGLVFMPKTGLQRYGLPECKQLPKTLKLKGRYYGAFRCKAVVGAVITHPIVAAKEKPLNDRFHEHLDECPHCADNPFELCELGSELLNDAVESMNLPPIWEEKS